MAAILDFNTEALVNYKNYYVYANSIMNRNSTIEVYVPEITISNIDDHIDAIHAILKDGCETDYIHELNIHIKWESASCNLSIVDYWYNLIMWYMILKTDQKIRPRHIFTGSSAYIPDIAYEKDKIYPYELKRRDIKNYVNTYVLTLENKIKFGNKALNKIIADGLWRYAYIEDFSYYLANTINNEDDIALSRAVPQFRDLLHISLAGIPFEDVKNQGQMATNEAIKIIKNSEYSMGFEHGLTNSFRAEEAINPRQYKEASLNIGTKPNGSGGIYPYIIDKNFKTGGVNDPLSYFIESSTARAAQIMSKTNVGESGNFARLLGLNNTDTILNPDTTYECLSQHFVKIELKTAKHVSMFKNRIYRMNPRGIDNILNGNDKSMIGKTIYLHSPMTCASNSAGHGICKKCYGNLYWTNYDINPGKIAAEILSAQLTQTLLSAKHLLETKIVNINWNPEFKDYFNIDINSIKLSDDFLDDDSNSKKFTMIIDPEQVQLVNEEEDTVSYEDGEESIVVEEDTGVYNEYITSFIIRTPEGVDITFGSEEQTELYISQDLNNIIRKKASNTDGKINIPLSSFDDSVLFYIKINNNEISKTMNDIINIINKSSVTEKMSKDEALQYIVDLVIDGNLSIDAVHLEVILSNQIVDPDDILKKPNWNNPAAKSRMFTLNQALTNNPSVIISLLYKDLHKVLYNPLTFTKNAPSFFDLFFCEQPQLYMDESLYVTEVKDIKDYENGVKMYTVVNNETREDELMKKIEEAMDKK